MRKGGKHVTIPIAPRPSRAIDLYIGERSIGPIFLGVEGGRMDRYCADRMVKRLTKRAGIDKKISPHPLRHSFITAALDAGVPLRDVQEAASHADPRTQCDTTGHAGAWIGTRLTSCRPSSLSSGLDACSKVLHTALFMTADEQFASRLSGRRAAVPFGLLPGSW